MQSTTSTVCLLEEGTTRSDAVVGNKLKNGEITLALSAIASNCAANLTNTGTATSIGTVTGAGASVRAEAPKAGDALPNARADANADGTSGDMVSTDDNFDIDGMAEEMTRYRPRSPGGKPAARSQGHDKSRSTTQSGQGSTAGGGQGHVKSQPTTKSGQGTTKKPRPAAITVTSPTTSGFHKGK